MNISKVSSLFGRSALIAGLFAVGDSYRRLSNAREKEKWCIAPATIISAKVIVRSSGDQTFEETYNRNQNVVYFLNRITHRLQSLFNRIPGSFLELEFSFKYQEVLSKEQDGDSPNLRCTRSIRLTYDIFQFLKSQEKITYYDFTSIPSTAKENAFVRTTFLAIKQNSEEHLEDKANNSKGKHESTGSHSGISVLYDAKDPQNRLETFLDNKPPWLLQFHTQTKWIEWRSPYRLLLTGICVTGLGLLHLRLNRIVFRHANKH